jgi:hypothetical protein
MRRTHFYKIGPAGAGPSPNHHEDKKRPRLTVGGGEREVGRRMPAGAKIRCLWVSMINGNNYNLVQESENAIFFNKKIQSMAFPHK